MKGVMRLSWTDELYKVYENNCGKNDGENILLPIFHSTANAQIEVLLSEQGELINASRIEDKSDAVTIIPVTEDSGVRSSGIAPHPLADKLIYIAGDYCDYVPQKRGASKYYGAYMGQLQEWKNSLNTHVAVGIIYKYLKQASLIGDLVGCGVLVTDQETGYLEESEKINGISQEAAFVRFRINYEELVNSESRTWMDASLYESFTKFYVSKLGNRKLCYATGIVQPCTYKHPSKIRNSGDKAKLISSNDESGFTYRGRFRDKEEAFSVSYEYSQKVHNALKWLIGRQGVPIGSMIFVAWESNLEPLPPLLKNPLEEAEDGRVEDAGESEWDDLEAWGTENTDTLPAYRDRLRKAIWGSKDRIEVKSKAMLMALDAATTGRLAMTMYTEMALSDLYKNVEKWHCDCAWRRYDRKKKRREIRSYSLYEIVKCAFGTEQGNFIDCKSEIQSDVLMRLIPCVTEQRNVPKDIVQNLVNKASRPLAYKKRNNWLKVLEVTCGIIRKTMIEEQEKRNKRGEYDVALDKQCKNRDYLYGRLLAVAEAAEASTYTKEEKEKGRTTNAARYFETFANKPYQAWGNIYNRLQPYMNKMPYQRKVYYQELFGEIMELFEHDDYQCNSKLKPEFLLAYHCQLNEIYSKKTDVKEEE